jgi:hypothetical protein
MAGEDMDAIRFGYIDRPQIVQPGEPGNRQARAPAGRWRAPVVSCTGRWKKWEYPPHGFTNLLDTVVHGAAGRRRRPHFSEESS